MLITFLLISRGYNGEPVFILTDNNIWIKGVVESVIERDEPLSLIDLNRHASTNGGVRIPSTERQRSDSRPVSSSLRYLVSADNDFRETVDPSRLALGLSSEDLTQRYPVGARVVGKDQIDFSLTFSLTFKLGISTRMGCLTTTPEPSVNHQNWTTNIDT